MYMGLRFTSLHVCAQFRCRRLHVQMYWYSFAESAEGDLNPIHKVDLRWETHILICINAVSDTSLLMDTIYSVHSWFSSLRCPQFFTITVLLVTPVSDPTASILVTTSIPSSTRPKTTCFLLSHGISCRIKQNCDVFESLPPFTIDSSPRSVCLM